MIDFDATTCRICLEDGAIYPIFESNEEFDSVYAKLAVCIREKLQDLEGYPRNICLKCKNTSETICSFIARFDNTCEILKSKLIQVKNENKEDYIDINLSDNEPESEPFVYELQVDNVEPEAEKRDPTELLESLSHLTVKRIKVESDLCSQETACDKTEDIGKRKTGRPKKAVRKRGRPKAANKAVSTPNAENKLDATPAATKNNRASKDEKKPRTEKNEKVNRPIVLSTKQEKEENPSKVLLCDHCGATFSDKICLKRHIYNRHRERKFKCTKCPKDFFRKIDFDNHKRRHENVRPCVCDMCGKSFYDKKALKGHIRVVHNKIKSKRPIYKCQFCDRTYAYRRGVVIHERSVHTGERPAVCKICSGSFYDIVYLREHMRIHTGDTPFKCPVCARGYTQIGNMKSHMRNHRISQLDPDTCAKIKPNYFKFMRP